MCEKRVCCSFYGGMLVIEIGHNPKELIPNIGKLLFLLWAVNKAINLVQSINNENLTKAVRDEDGTLSA